MGTFSRRTADGNCLLHALCEMSASLKAQAVQHDSFRAQLVEYIEQNKVVHSQDAF